MPKRPATTNLRSVSPARLQGEPKHLEALRALTGPALPATAIHEVLPLQERLVCLDPKDAQTRVELAFNYLNHQGEQAKAVASLSEAVAPGPECKAPDLPRAGSERGW